VNDVAAVEFPTVNEPSLAIFIISFDVVVVNQTLNLNASLVPKQLETRPEFAPIPTN
jgi:hypothetical protein